MSEHDVVLQSVKTVNREQPPPIVITPEKVHRETESPSPPKSSLETNTIDTQNKECMDKESTHSVGQCTEVSDDSEFIGWIVPWPVSGDSLSIYSSRCTLPPPSLCASSSFGGSSYSGSKSSRNTESSQRIRIMEASQITPKPRSCPLPTTLQQQDAKEARVGFRLGLRWSNFFLKQGKHAPATKSR